MPRTSSLEQASLSCFPRRCTALAIILLCGCGGQPRKVQTAPTTRPTSVQQGRIEGDLERIPPLERKRMRIWGRVQRIISKPHGDLPPLQTVSRGFVGDPVTKIVNETQFKLVIWFAGECSHQTEVPASGSITAVFCPGSYNIAAVVDNDDYLPLVRENQQFKAGIGYELKFIIKRRPSLKSKH